MPFLTEQKVLFKHCDPAGIVFYPRYFEMMNDTVEDFFSTGLQAPFENLHKKGAVPTVDIHTQFKKPSRHGDRLAIELKPLRIGNASLDISIVASCKDEVRFITTMTLVNVNAEGRPIVWSESIRAKIDAMLEV